MILGAVSALPSVGAGLQCETPGRSVVEIPLKSSFRYVHEPLSANEDALPQLGNDRLKAALQGRILHSRGGTFLITGFRGVGKSTLVRLALGEIVADSPPSVVVLPVYISVARCLGAATDFVIPKVSFSGQRNQSRATEAAFLAYSETDAEHDLMRIVAMVSRDQVIGARRRFRPQWLWRQSRGGLSSLRLVVVLDEVDKLTVGEAGLANVDDLLTGIKNVLTANMSVSLQSSGGRLSALSSSRRDRRRTGPAALCRRSCP